MENPVDSSAGSLSSLDDRGLRSALLPGLASGALMIHKSVGVVMALMLVVAGLLVAPTAASASATSTTKIGAWSKDWGWFDQAIGPVDVYRGYDSGFNYPTWQDVPRPIGHPGGMNDYSFTLPPADVAAGAKDSVLRTFIASTPKNIVLT